MKLSDFILLDEKEKQWTVLHQGILIGKRTFPAHMVFLFQLNNYYVETYCNTTNKVVEEYRVFEDTTLLRPYLEAISIDDLLN